LDLGGGHGRHLLLVWFFAAVLVQRIRVFAVF
jgi:hypothetical protein